MIKEIYYQCETCQQKFTYKSAGHSIKVPIEGKEFLKACRGELKKKLSSCYCRSIVTKSKKIAVQSNEAQSDR